jgi:SAM-dependent methyltransferase
MGAAALRARADERTDALSYLAPWLVPYMDPGARFALTLLLRDELSALAPSARTDERCGAVDVLELGAGASSDLPGELAYGRVHGVGLCEDELVRNGRLSDYAVLDLNAGVEAGGGGGSDDGGGSGGGCADGGGGGADGGGSGADGGAPRLLPHLEDASFDLVLVSGALEYLVRPVAVLAEARRVLRTGGRLVVAFSSRLALPDKASAFWRAARPADKACFVAAALRYASRAGREWGGAAALDLSPSLKTDPLYVVTATAEPVPEAGAEA